jgi:hypothetical protein
MVASFLPITLKSALAFERATGTKSLQRLSVQDDGKRSTQCIPRPLHLLI